MGEALPINNEESFTPPVSPRSSLPPPAVYHAPVLLEECMRALRIKPNGTYVDCTLGGGGHFQALIDRLDIKGVAVGIDRDPEAIAWSDAHLRRGKGSVTLLQRHFSRLHEVLDALGIAAVDGILADLGISSHQIRTDYRGFSYMHATPLDMRMDPSDACAAADILEIYPAAKLARVFSEYGEVRNPLRMAESIVRFRSGRPLKTSDDLKECLRQEYGNKLNIAMLAKLFQSLRIAVNDELTELRRLCDTAVGVLRLGGRIAVISYHSLEDRLVKNFMRDKERGCTCPPSAPMCICGNRPTLKRITRKAIVPSQAEVRANPASRSARLRVAEKIALLIDKSENQGSNYASKR